MLNLAGIIDTTYRIALQQGLAGMVSIVRPAGTTVDPTSNVASGAQVTQTVRCIGLNDTKWRTRGGAWSSAVSAILVPADDLSFVPDIGDRATWGGVTLTIMERSPVQTDGVTALAWEFALGGLG